MLKSEKLFSPQNYLLSVTGNCYVIDGDNDVDTIESILEENDLCLWSYPLSEMDYIVENSIDVVLVECLILDEWSGDYEKVLRFFEVPDDFVG